MPNSTTNVADLASTIDFLNTLRRLDLISSFSAVMDTIVDLEAQYQIIKYRSHQTINDTYGGKYDKSTKSN